MRSVSGACGRVIYGPKRAPFGLSQLIHNGQSLSDGAQSTASNTGALLQPYGNVKLSGPFGSEGLGYDITTPDAVGLSLVPMVTPQRPNTNNVYPGNVQGNSGEVFAANAISALAQQDGITFRLFGSCTGLTSTPITGTNKPNRPYEAGLYECRVAASGPGNGGLAVKLGAATFATLASIFTGGETDGIDYAAANTTDPSLFQALLEQEQLDYETDTRAAGAVTIPDLLHVPMALSQCDTSPGSLTGLPIVTTAMNNAFAANALRFILACAKYPSMQFQADGFHYFDYRAMFEKVGQYIYRYVKECRNARNQKRAPNPLAWTALQVTNVVHSPPGTITCTVHLPDGAPLVIDTTTVTQPHTSGAWSMWANGLGFEVWEHQVNIVSASNATPIVVDAPGHGLTDGQTAGLVGVLGNTAANGAYFAHVIDGNTYQLFHDAGFTSPVAGNGAPIANSGISFHPLPINPGLNILGNTISFTLGIVPTALPAVAAGYFADGAYNTGGCNPPRRTCIRNVSTYRGPSFFEPMADGNPPPEHLYDDWLLRFMVQL